MSKPAPSRYRTTDWSEYNAALRRRGSLLVWVDREMGWSARKRGRPGRPHVFSDAAIQFCLSIKVLFGLALRQTIGMVASLLKLAGLEGWPVPDYSTLCRRQKAVIIQIPFRRVGDSPVLPDLLEQIPRSERIGTVTADGAFDTRRCHTAIVERGVTAIIPIRRNGRAWKEDCPAAKARNETLRATQRFGRAFWKRWTGYHTRSRIEAQMLRLKAFGERISARDPDHQTAEIHIRIALTNRFSALGTAEIVRVA